MPKQRNYLSLLALLKILTVSLQNANLKHALQQYTNALVECDISSHDTDINIWTKYAKTKKLYFFTGITQDFNSFSAKCQWYNEGVHGISA